MLNRTPLWITAIAAAAVGLSACGGGAGTTVTSPSPSSTTSASAPTPTPSTTPTRSAPRTGAEIKSALLGLKDLPSGFEADPSAESGNDDPASSSKDPKCAPLVKLTNAKTAPGSKASAKIAFSGGQDGPAVEESIDALGSAGDVKALQASFRSAVAACPVLTLTIPGVGSAKLKVAEVSAPADGEDTFAVRMTATGGPLDGMEITQVTAGVLDAIVALTFMGALPDDVDLLTEAAVAKAEDVLGPVAATT